MTNSQESGRMVRMKEINTAIRVVEERDWPAIAMIFNHFVSESFAAYSEEPVDSCFFRSRQQAALAYPFLVAEHDGQVVGFAYLAPFHPASTMKHSATLTYFIRPEFTGTGIGSQFLDILLQKGGEMGITNFLAHISSKNTGSIRFHQRKGFTECGRLIGVGVKRGEPFDMVWVQKRSIQDEMS